MKYYVLCMLEQQAVFATRRAFDSLSEALDYSATINDNRYPMVMSESELKRLSEG